MLRNYIKIALRNIRKQKIYSFINILGLSVGIACFILIYLFIEDELSYDLFHKNKDRLYRLVKVETKPTGEKDYTAYQPVPLAPEIKNDIPVIKRAVRYMQPRATVSFKGKSFLENPLLADPDFLEMFTFTLLKGDPGSALLNKNSVVISEQLSKLYFDQEDPLGEVLSIKIGDQTRNYTVTGVLKDVPDNSSISFKMILPFLAYPYYDKYISNWGSSRATTFIELADGIKPADLKENTGTFIEKHFGDRIRSFQNTGFLSKEDDAFTLYFQPFEDIHFATGMLSREPASDPVYSYILSVIALMVLLLACINYMTLASGRSMVRIKEVGVRKVLGAGKKQITGQFLSESVIFS
ncbi:ABC transporter permease, partial [candidate division KSB1 bacterium]